MRLCPVMRHPLVLVDLIVKAAVQVRPPVEGAIEAGEVLLLGHVGRVVLRVRPIPNFGLHLRKDSSVRLQEHDASIDARGLLVWRQLVALAPRRVLPDCLVWHSLAMHRHRRPPLHRRRGRQLECALKTTATKRRSAHEQIEVQQQDLLQVGHLQGSQLREDIDEPALPPIVKQSAANAGDVLHLLATPSAREQGSHIGRGNIRSVQQQPRHIGTRMPLQPPTEHQRAQKVRVAPWAVEQRHVRASRKRGRWRGRGTVRRPFGGHDAHRPPAPWAPCDGFRRRVALRSDTRAANCRLGALRRRGSATPRHLRMRIPSFQSDLHTEMCAHRLLILNG
mmetsp:Transcript_42114/g.119132  ORF Transcript_42114/g.119132 Transcript_42114/m.119132 type:complete len:336 (+) Transcript_42114:364-1371(+)